MYGCSSNSKEEKENVIINQITKEVAEQIKQKYDMHLVGTGSGENKGINMLGISFAIYRPLKRDEIRPLIIAASQLFLEKINSAEGLRPFLKKYPFTIENIKIFYTAYSSKNVEPVFDPYIAGGFLDKTHITYLTHGPKDRYQYNSEYTEKYEEAFEIVDKQKANL
jgi:hypothetical protein